MACRAPITNSTAKVTVQYPDIHTQLEASQISTSLPSSALSFFFDAANLFMNAVQPKNISEGFPGIEIDQIDSYVRYNQHAILTYETPVLILCCLGVLFMLIMPIFGIVFCCCRCCGKCGGKMYQEPRHSERHWVCGIYSFLLSLLILVMLPGVLLMVVTNNRIHAVAGSAQKTCQDGVQEGMSIGSSVMKTLDEIKFQIPCSFDYVRTDLSDDTIGRVLGVPVRDLINASVSPVVDEVIPQEIALVNNLKVMMVDLETAIATLSPTAKNVTVDIEGFITALNDTTTQCWKDTDASLTLQCSELSKVTINSSIDFSSVPNLIYATKKQQDIVDLDIIKNAQNGLKIIRDIPNIIIRKSTLGREKIRLELDDVKKEFDREIRAIQNDIDNDFLKRKDEFLGYCKYADKDRDYFKYENYRFYAYIGLSSIVGLIVLLLGAGLALGICGYRRDVLPSHRSRTSTSGGNFLMASVGFMFIFSFPLMLFCVVWFTAGIHLHIACRDIQDGSLIDELGRGRLMVNGKFVSVKETLEKCKLNQTLFTAMGGDRIINLSKKLNISQYSLDLRTLADFNVDISDQSVFNDDLLNAFKEMQSFGDTIDFEKFYKELNRSVVIDYNSAIDQLGNIANEMRSNGALTFSNEVEQLKNHVQNIKAGNFSIVNNRVREVTVKVRNLQVKVNEIMLTATNTLKDLKQSNDYIDNEATTLLKTLIKKFSSRLMFYLEQMSSHLINQVKTNALKCKPVVQLYDGIVNTFVCKTLVHNLNGFWLALGWCLVFFIPSVIVSVRLAKYYRRMEYELGYEHVVTYPPYNDKIPMQRFNYSPNPNLGNRYEREPPPPYSDAPSPM